MAVYVDDAGIPATVGRHRSRWSHLFADTKDELHEFAARLGLKRSWFQDPMINSKAVKMGFPPKPGSYAAESWHYDVTEPKRQQAIKLGAVPITWRESVEVIRARVESTDE